MKKIIYILIVFAFFALLTPAVHAQSDPTDIMNNLIGPSQQYNTMVTPAYTRNNSVEDYIDSQTGELNLKQTDYVLPGVNGLDLEIKRIYKSGSASLYKNSVKYQNGVLIDYLDNTLNAGNTYENTFYETRYNLGCGWRFSFPTIENNGGFLYLHMESGDVYALTGSAIGVYTIQNHPVQDLTVKACSSLAFTSQNVNSAGQTVTMNSYYVMTEKNGKKTYFDADGRILGIIDRYGNTITFQYKDSLYNLYGGAIKKTLISKIIDTLGRTVTIDYKEDPTFQVTGYNSSTGTADANLQNKFEVIIGLPNGKTIVYDKSLMSFLTSSLHVARTSLQSVYDVDAALPITSASPAKTWYDYETVKLGFTFVNGTTYNASNNNTYMNITGVTNRKANYKKSFSYGDATQKMYRFVKPLVYANGSMEYRKVVRAQDIDTSDGSIKNDVAYSYTNEPQGYYYDTASSTWKMSASYNTLNLSAYNYYTQVTDGRGAQTKYTYNGNGQTISTEKSGNDHDEVITTTYNAIKLPSIVKTTTYNVVNSVKGSSLTKIENYTYDTKGNLTQYTGPEAARDANGNPTGSTYNTPESTVVNEHTVVYTYDPNFSLLQTKTWKQDSSTIGRVEYTIDSANGNVTQMINKSAQNSIITDYLYDVRGKMTQKTVHYANNSGSTYTTYYVYGSEEDDINRGGAAAKYKGLYYGGAYLTREYSIVDGAQVSKKYAYDFNTGLKTADYDQNNNCTSYGYDVFSRINLITYPDNSTKQYLYTDPGSYTDYKGTKRYNRIIQYTDQNLNQFQYIYDILGNMVQYNAGGKVIKQLSYDANGNKIKEMDAYGHSYQFVYDSANRLKEKSFWSDDSTKVKSISLGYTMAYDTNTSQLLTITDEDGYSKKYYYDVLNKLYKLDVTPDKANFYSTNYTYDYIGNKKSESDAYGNATTYTYDDLGRLKAKADARSHTTQYSYDSANKLVQEINPRSKSTYYDYDTLGRMIRKKEPSADGTQAVTRYIYDAAGNKKKEVTPNNYLPAYDDSADHATTMAGISYSYDNMNRLQFTYNPNGTVLEARSYDGNGNVKKVVDGLRYTGDINTSAGTVYQYDAFDRKVQETDALGNVQSYTYYLTGQVNTYTDANQNTTTYNIYPDGNVQQVIYPDTSSVTYTYDNRGNKASEKDQNSNTTNYKYNGFGKIDTVTDPKQNTIVYSYYNNGNLYSEKDKRGHYTYYFYYPDNDLQQKNTSVSANNFSIEKYITDECGNATQKILTGTLDSASSRVVTNTYYDNNLLNTSADTSAKDSSGSYTRNYYDKDKNVIKVETKRDASNTDVIKYTYDIQDRKTASIKLVDQSDILNAAALPNISNLRDPDYAGKIQQKTGYVYDILGNITSTIDPRAYGYLDTDTANRSLYTVTNSYDNLNRLLAVSRVVNGTSVYSKNYYDAAGNKKAVRDENGYYTVYTYDSMKRQLTVTDSEIDTSLKSYTEAQIISLAGQKTNTLKKTITYSYDPAGNKKYEVDANGYKTEYGYDSLNRLQTIKAPYDPNSPDSLSNPYNQVVKEKVYDENGNVIKEIDAKGYLSGSDDSSRYGTEYTYDYANRPLTVLDPENKKKGLTFTSKYEYNQYGEKTKSTDACNNSTSYNYNSAGKLLNVTDALTITTAYTYDNEGNQLTMVNGKQKTTGHQYGAFGLARTLTDANSRTITYKYDLVGNMADMLDRNGNDTVFTYDSRNLLLSKSVSSTGDAISYTYDSTGNRATMTDASGSYSYMYYANNRLKSISKGGVTQISYQYDNAGNVLNVADVKGFSTSYTYDKANRMSTVNYTVNSSNRTTQYSYDINGNRESVTYPGGISESYQYDKNNKLVSLTNTLPGKSTNYGYTYYANGLQETKTDSYGTTRYTYDGDGRIKQIDGPGKTTVYTYDNAGNRQSMDETYTSAQYSGYTDQATGKNLQYLIKHSDYIYSDTNALMQLTETMKDTSGNEILVKAATYQYDDNGNEVSQQAEYLQASNPVLNESSSMTAYNDSAASFSPNLERTENAYDGFNRLIKVDVIKSGNRSISEFTYNGDDLRVKKIVKKSSNNYQPQEINYLYDGQYVILETDASSNVQVRYVKGTSYIGRIDSGNKLSYFLFNGHGDVVQTVSESGVVENQYDYDIFGNLTLTVETQYTCAIRYAGEFYDSESGLYYLRARYYDSYVGRFTSEDSYAGSTNDPLSLNLYTYCYNEPIGHFDPSGHIVTNWDKSHLNSSQIAVVQAATAAWNLANKIGSKTGMAAAHELAVSARSGSLSSNEYVDKSGYVQTGSSGGSSGSNSSGSSGSSGRSSSSLSTVSSMLITGLSGILNSVISPLGIIYDVASSYPDKSDAAKAGEYEFVQEKSMALFSGPILRPHRPQSEGINVFDLKLQIPGFAYSSDDGKAILQRLYTAVTKDRSWVAYKTYRFDDAIGRIMNLHGMIKEVSEKMGIEKAVIAGVLFREIMFTAIDDEITDGKEIMGIPLGKNIGIAQTSVKGVRQDEKEYIKAFGGTYYYSHQSDEYIKKCLMTDTDSVYFAALQLCAKAGNAGIKTKEQLATLNEAQIKKIYGWYNASNGVFGHSIGPIKTGQVYAEETYVYYEIFKELYDRGWAKPKDTD